LENQKEKENCKFWRR